MTGEEDGRRGGGGGRDRAQRRGGGGGGIYREVRRSEEEGEEGKAKTAETDGKCHYVTLYDYCNDMIINILLL